MALIEIIDHGLRNTSGPKTDPKSDPKMSSWNPTFVPNFGIKIGP